MGPFRQGGLARATTLSAGGNMVLLYVMLRRNIGPFGSGRILGSGDRTSLFLKDANDYERDRRGGFFAVTESARELGHPFLQM